jgi:hypothetical protein
MADSAGMYDTIYLLSFHGVRWFGGLTSEFAEEFEEKKLTQIKRDWGIKADWLG